MELTDVYRRAPGCCSVCGTPSTTHGVVDLRIDDMANQHRSFAVYLCGECALQVGQLAGMRAGKALMPVDTVDQLAAAQAQVTALQARLDEYETIFEQVRTVTR